MVGREGRSQKAEKAHAFVLESLWANRKEDGTSKENSFFVAAR